MNSQEIFREGVKLGAALKSCCSTMVACTVDMTVLSFRQLCYQIQASKYLSEDEKKDWLSKIDEVIWLTERGQLRPLDIHRLFESSLLA